MSRVVIEIDLDASPDMQSPSEVVGAITEAIRGQSTWWDDGPLEVGDGPILDESGKTVGSWRVE